MRAFSGGGRGEREAPVQMQLESALGTAMTVRDPQVSDPAGATTFDLRPQLTAALIGIRDDLGFETASLFAPGPSVWKLLERQGPRRPWHTVLDPSAL